MAREIPRRDGVVGVGHFTLCDRDGIGTQFTANDPEHDEPQQQGTDGDKPVALRPHESGNEIVPVTEAVSQRTGQKTASAGRKGGCGIDREKCLLAVHGANYSGREFNGGYDSFAILFEKSQG